MFNDITSIIPRDKYFTSSKGLSTELDIFLSSLPWEISGHRLDWHKISHLHFYSLDSNKFFLDGDKDNLYAFKCFSEKYTIFMYSAFYPCLIIDTNFVVNNFSIFDDLYHATYFFSVEDFIDPDNLNPHKENFLELDPSRKITGIIDKNAW